MDTVFITGLAFDTTIGIYDWEREIKQRIVVDLELATDVRKAAETEDITHALNYAEISERVQRFVESSAYQLIETMAEDLAQLILCEYNTPKVLVTIHKPGAVKMAQDLGVKIERTRDDLKVIG